MRNLYINHQRIIISRRSKEPDDRGLYKYSPPFSFCANLAPVDSESEVKEYGERHINMYKSVVPRSMWEGKISDDDAVYINAGLSDGKDNDVKANYRVESVRYTLNTMTVYFEKKEMPVCMHI